MRPIPPSAQMDLNVVGGCVPIIGKHTWTWTGQGNVRMQPPVWLRCDCGKHTWGDRLRSGTPLEHDKIEVTE